MEVNPIDFSQLPLNLQTRIVEKFLYTDFARLDESSQLGHAVCWAETYSLPAFMPTVYISEESTILYPMLHYFVNETHPKVTWEVASQPPARIIGDSLFVTDRLSSERIRVAAKQLEENNFFVSMVTIDGDIGFKSDDLDMFLKATTPKFFTCNKFLPREFCQGAAIQKVSNLYLTESGCTDEELVNLKAKDMLQVKSDFITAKGINTILKQWRRKERELYTVIIKYGTSRDININEILEGVDANPIWTPEMHEDSLIAPVKLEEYYPVTTGDPDRLYVMWRSDDLANTVFIRIKKGKFEVFTGCNEAVLLLTYLNDDQYYAVMNECVECRTQFCEHRRPPGEEDAEEVAAQDGVF